MIKSYQNQQEWSKADQATPEIKQQLADIRQAIENESISHGEIVELQNLAEYIPLGDTILLEWADIPEFIEEEK